MTKNQSDQLFTAITSAIERSLRPLQAEVAALRTQLAAKRYRGIWQAAESYEKGNLVTHDGSLWVAIDDQPSKPGQSGGGWQLAAKRGADAR